MASAYQELMLAAASSDWLAAYGWPLLFFFMLFVVSLYIWSYLNKQLVQMQGIDSDYVNADIVVYMGLIIKAGIVIVLLFLLAFVASKMWADFDEFVWQPFLGLFIQLAIVIMVLIFAGLVVKMLRHFSRRSRLPGKGVKGFSSSALEFIIMLLSYVVYIAAALVVISLLLTDIFKVDAIKELTNFLRDKAPELGALIIFWVSVILVTRLTNAIFEDYKYRTKKFNPQIVDLFKSLVRNALYLIAFLVTIFILFKLMDLQEVGLILVVMIVVFICLAIALSYGTVKNIISGVAIMNTEIFAIGDKIKIGQDLVCEVVEKNLVFTKVRTEEGETVDVPNSEIISSRVLNYDRSLAHGISVTFKVHSSIPHSEVQVMVSGAVAKVEGLIKEPAPEVFARDFDGDMVVYEVHAYVRDALKAKRTRSELILMLREESDSGELRPLSRSPRA